MNDLTNDKHTIADLKARLMDSSYDGGALVGTALDYFESVQAGDLQIVDPSNPAVLLLEMMAVSTSNAVEHSDNNLANRYVSLATNFEQLYPHMTDEDHKDIFALSGTITFGVLVPIESLLDKGIPDPTNTYKYVSIPKDTEVRVGEMTYTFRDRIEIRTFVSNAIKVIRIGEGDNQISSYTVDNQVFRDATNAPWLRFDLDLDQVTKRSQVFNVLRSANFEQDMDFPDQFKSVKVFEKEGDTLSEISTRYIEDIYDPLTKTAIIRVLEGRVRIFIPKIYSLSREILVLVESTKGDIDVDYYRYDSAQFTYSLRDLKRELSASDEAFNSLVANIISNDRLVGGRAALTYVELRERIMDNTIGVNKVPITQKQVLSNISLINFDSYRTVDSLTGRTYVVSSDVPLITNSQFTTEVDMSFINLKTNLTDLGNYPTVMNNPNSVTILPETIYKVETKKVVDGRAVSIVDASTINAWKARDNKDILDIDQRNWRVSPFFYVINHQGQTLDTKAYQLDKPSISIVDHITNNYSTDLFMSSKFSKVEYQASTHSYVLTITLKNDAKLREEAVGDVWGQAIMYERGKRYNLDMHSIDTDEEGLITMSFVIETDLDVWDDNIIIKNLMDEDGVLRSISTTLLSDIYVAYGTITIPNNYSTSQINEVVYQDINLAHKYPLTLEKLSVKFGKELTYLWTDSRLISTTEYAKWEHDVPLLYDKTEVPYDISQGDDIIPFRLNANCEVVYNESHHKGDVKVDHLGNVIYKYRKGELKRDANNNLIPISTVGRTLTLDLLTFNGIVDFVNNPETIGVIDKVVEFVIRQATKDILPLLDVAAEHTELLYKPKSSLGLVKVSVGNDEVVWLDKEQRFVVNVLVSPNVYDDPTIRDKIKTGITDTLSDTIQNLTVSYSDLINEIKKALGELVIAVSVNGFGGGEDKNLSVTILDAGDRLSVAKKLILDEQLDLTLVEDIQVYFKRSIPRDEHNELR